jgi:hypothetical protein
VVALRSRGYDEEAVFVVVCAMECGVGVGGGAVCVFRVNKKKEKTPSHSLADTILHIFFLRQLFPLTARKVL